MEFWDGSGISWTICKQCAPCSRQITTSASHHSSFTGRMLFLTSNQQRQSTEDRDQENNRSQHKVKYHDIAGTWVCGGIERALEVNTKSHIMTPPVPGCVAAARCGSSSGAVAGTAAGWTASLDGSRALVKSRVLSLL